MSRRPNKVEQFFANNPSGLRALNERCAGLVKPTLAKIVDMLDEMGLDISLPAADTYRENTLAEFMAGLQSDTEFAESIATIAKQGLALSDAAAVGLSRKIFQRSRVENLNDGELDQLSLALARLRTGDHRAKILEARLRAYEQKEQEWNDARAKVKAAVDGAKGKGGLTKEALKQIEEAAAIL